MADTAPANRAERRARGRPPKGTGVLLRHPASPDSLAARRQRASQVKSEPQVQDTGISSEYGVPADMPPDNLGQVEQEAPAVFSGYKGKYGLLKTNIVTSYATVGLLLGGPTSPDGVLFLGSAETIADAWISWGKTDPRYMRIVNVLWGGPFMTLALAHAPLVGGLMANHGMHMPKFLNFRQMPMFKAPAFAGQNAAAVASTPTPLATDDGTPPYDPFMAAYRPVGANAPTEDPGPPPAYTDGPLRTFPDEGVPSDVDSQLRTLAKEMGIPYAQLRDQYLLETAQDRIAQNQKVVQPAALGVPVTQPEM